MEKFIVKTSPGKVVIKTFKTYDSADEFALRNSYEKRLRVWRSVGITPGCEGEHPDSGSYYKGEWKRGG